MTQKLFTESTKDMREKEVTAMVKVLSASLLDVVLCIHGTMGEWAYLINQKQRFASPQLQISVLTVQ